MPEIKDSPYVVAMVIDVVNSRRGNRASQHAALLQAAGEINEVIPAIDDLRPTVGDEFQGIYATVGMALTALYRLRLAVAPEIDLRAGLGGGELTVIDAERGIQDGSAWWLAREAIDEVKALAQSPGYRSSRTAVKDSRPGLPSHADALSRLIDSCLHRLRPGVAKTLLGLLDGKDNAEVATQQGISGSANSQRIATNDLRILADAIQALSDLP